MCNTHTVRVSIREGTEELDDCPMSPKVHPEGGHHALLSQVDGSQASRGHRIGGAQSIQEVLNIIIEFLEFPRFLKLVCLLDILHHSVILKTKHFK